MLLVHGIGDNGVRDWYPVLGALAASRRVVAVDLPGFGRSSRGNRLYHPVEYSRFLAHVIRTHLGGRADLVGHSLGASVALGTASMEPTLVRRLALLDAAGILCQEALVSEYARGAPARDIWHELITGLSGLAPDPNVLLRSPALRNVFLSGDPSRIAALALLATNFDTAVAGVRTPTALIWGRRDTVAPLRTFEVLSRRLPAVRTLLLDRVGHNPMAERPQVVALELRSFFEDAGPWSSPTSRRPDPDLDSTRSLDCAEQSGKVYTGRFARVRLGGCRNLVIRDATIERLEAVSSTLELINVSVTEGTVLTESRLRATTSDLKGTPGLSLNGSVADLAGVSVQGVSNAKSPIARSRVVGSLSRVVVDGASRGLHGVLDLSPGEELKVDSG